MARRSDYNYNYVFVLYDINEERVQKVFKICKKYLNHHQKSIFRGNITPSKLIKLRNELKRIINPQEDTISILKFISQSSFDEETIGLKIDSDETMFI